MNLWDSDWSITIPALIAGYGALVGLGGAGWYAFKKRRLARWTKAKGRVESYEELHLDDTDGARYNPIIVFADTFGRQVSFTAANAVWARKVYEEGSEIPVLFDPNRPQRAVIDRWAERYTEVVYLYILSGFMITGALGLACFFRFTK
jgi:hypothetical protein